MNLIKCDPALSKLQNSDILKDLDPKLSHLDPIQRKELKQLIHEYEHLFPDIPSGTDKIYHDVNVEDSQPVKQHPYRMNPTNQKYLKEEIQYMLDNDCIEPSQMNGVLLVFLFHNRMDHIACVPITGRPIILSKTDTFPIPRMDDCIDKIGYSKYITNSIFWKDFGKFLSQKEPKRSQHLLLLMDYITIK